ncbi:MAG TPA: site-specific recombinase [Myxococcaceae bacterium]|nr:site-specific recombinase [Myxococcaceae bacterium]
MSAPALKRPPDEPAATPSDFKAFAQTFAPHAKRVRVLRPLHTLLTCAQPEAPLPVRMEWLENLVRWVCGGKSPGFLGLGEGQTPQYDRLRLLVDVLKGVPDWRASFSGTLRRILAETSGLRLFCSTGLPATQGFISEAVDRVLRRVLPVPPSQEDLAELLLQVFSTEEDAVWLVNLPAPLVAELGALLRDGEDASFDAMRPVRESMADAALLLASRITALGMSDDMRARSPEFPLRESPFLELFRAVDAYLKPMRPHFQPMDPAASQAAAHQVRFLMSQCRQVIRTVHGHLEAQGVSVNLVFRLELISRSLDRIDALTRLMPRAASEPQTVELAGLGSRVLATMVRDAIRQRSLRALFQTNLRQLSRKVIERAGVSGEHYITSTRAEYLSMLGSAAGGGLLTAGTASLKFLVGWAHLPFFFEGLFLSLNYAGSFLLMQFLGFTLATKQPSMTAAALAGSLRDQADESQMEGLVGLISRITRSQLAAIIGNIGMVMPVAFALDLILRATAGTGFLDLETAEYVVHSLHPLKSGTVFFAALTGVFLWVSSTAAGWLENWAVYRKLPEAIAGHRGLRRLMGVEQADRTGRWLSRSISGFGGNVTLGFILGMARPVSMFFGLPIDVRHVTLSTAALVLAGCAVGRHGVLTAEFGWAVAGIAIIGLLNFGVSFALALAVAMRARDVRGSAWFFLTKAVARRFRKAPWEFFFPSGPAVAMPATGAIPAAVEAAAASDAVKEPAA